MAVARQRPARNNGITVGSDVFYMIRSEAISRDRPCSVSECIADEYSGV
jgi:hypothetical protein